MTVSHSRWNRWLTLEELKLPTGYWDAAQAVGKLASDPMTLGLWQGWWWASLINEVPSVRLQAYSMLHHALLYNVSDYGLSRDWLLAHGVLEVLRGERICQFLTPVIKSRILLGDDRVLTDLGEDIASTDDSRILVRLRSCVEFYEQVQRGETWVEPALPKRDESSEPRLSSLRSRPRSAEAAMAAERKIPPREWHRVRDVRLPAYDMGFAVVTLLSVAVGDHVNAGQIILECETDKAILEVPTPHAGVVLEWFVQPGDFVYMNGTPRLYRIEESE